MAVAVRYIVNNSVSKPKDLFFPTHKNRRLTAHSIANCIERRMDVAKGDDNLKWFSRDSLMI